MDAFVTASIILSFAAFVTAHVALCAGLAVRDPWWRGVLAFAVPLLAPVWAFQEGMRGRAILWSASGTAYVAMRFVEHTMTR
ncbi:MAG TPA: hypothetical protein VF395_21660 [Polyangiaceae bacterium]